MITRISKGKLLLKGKGAGPGKIKARISIVRNLCDSAKMVEGNILVTSMTSPSWLPVMVKASAVITEQGGILSHPAIVCRELGIPAVVVAEGATEKLKDGSTVFVDGFSGEIYETNNR